jgi:hypothetical protein
MKIHDYFLRMISPVVDEEAGPSAFYKNAYAGYEYKQINSQSFGISWILFIILLSLGRPVPGHLAVVPLSG